jgi:hypothetical protein
MGRMSENNYICGFDCIVTYTAGGAMCSMYFMHP